jgi:hypothetical protein
LLSKDSDIHKKHDYTAPTEGTFTKMELLPAVMQVRDFGKMSRTKWTHLVKEVHRHHMGVVVPHDFSADSHIIDQQHRTPHPSMRAGARRTQGGRRRAKRDVSDVGNAGTSRGIVPRPWVVPLGRGATG